MKLRKKSPHTVICGPHKSGNFVLIGKSAGKEEAQEFIIHGGERANQEEMDRQIARLPSSFGNGLEVIVRHLSEDDFTEFSNNKSILNQPEKVAGVGGEPPVKSIDYSGMPFEKIISCRTSEILKQFIKPGAVPKVAYSPDRPIHHTENLFKVSASKSFDENVLLFCSELGPGQSFCMVRINDENYRDHYVNFINYVYGTNFTEAEIPKRYDIDHMLARSNAPSSAWIRIEAVLASVNRSHGAGVEKRNSTSGVVRRRKEEDSHHGNMTWLSAAKLAEIFSPLLSQSTKHKERRNLLIKYYVSVGFSKESVEAGIRASIHRR